MDFKTLKEASEAYEKLQAINKSQEAELSSISETIKQQHSTIEDQSYEIEELHGLINELRNAKPTSVRDGFIHSRTGKQYDLLATHINLKGVEYSAAEIIANEDLQAELIAMGAGVIVERQEKEA